MVEKQIEDKIIEALKQNINDGVQYVGSWNTSIGGEVVNAEDDSHHTIVDVQVGIRQYDTAQIPTANIPCSITTYTRIEIDPTGQKALDVARKTICFLQTMQSDLNSAISTFETSSFAVAGFRLDGGDNMRDIGKGFYSVAIRFTIRGAIAE